MAQEKGSALLKENPIKQFDEASWYSIVQRANSPLQFEFPRWWTKTPNLSIYWDNREVWRFFQTKLRLETLLGLPKNDTKFKQRRILICLFRSKWFVIVDAKWEGKFVGFRIHVVESIQEGFMGISSYSSGKEDGERNQYALSFRNNAPWILKKYAGFQAFWVDH